MLRSYAFLKLTKEYCKKHVVEHVILHCQIKQESLILKFIKKYGTS